MTNVIFPLSIPCFLATDRANRIFVRIEIRGKMVGFLTRPFLFSGIQRYHQ